jgi:protein SCO1
MKKSYIGLAFIILVFGIWTVKEFSARFKKSDLENRGKAPAFSFTNQNGKIITNKDYLGKVYVVEFFFSKCPTICPKMNANMLKLQDSFYGNLNFGMASITIDPENDTPEHLKEHAKILGVKNSNWHFLTANYEYTSKLASDGFKVYAGKNKEVPGGFEHSGLFALIDKEGNIRCRKDSFGNPIQYYDGLDENKETGVKAITEDIKALLKE